VRPERRPDPIRDPTYNLPSASGCEDLATPLEKALSAVKVGAILAAAVTVVLIYLGAYGGIKGNREWASVAVLVALVTPSAVAWVRARRARIRARRASREP
jgi:uncharacterized protein (DUF2062 family)